VVFDDAIEQKDAATRAKEAWEDYIRTATSADAIGKMATRSIFRAHGLVRVEEDVDPPEEKVNNDRIRRLACKTIEPRIVVTKEDREGDVPLHRYELAGSILNRLPIPPSDEWDALDAQMRAAWHKAEQHIWKLVQTKFGDAMQRWVRETLGNGLVLIKTAEDTVFLTAEPKFIRAELFQPLTDKLELQAVAMGSMLGAFAAEYPALRAPAKSLLKSTMKRAGVRAANAYGVVANGDTEAEAEADTEADTE
jgi:hypothetical protein